MLDVAIDVEALNRRLDAAPAVVRAAVRDKIAALSGELANRVCAKLSGEVLQSRSGALAGSIRSETGDGGDAPFARVFSQGVKYAAIQEYGGQTAAHDIVPSKALALAFLVGGRQVFAKIVHHPGSRIPARPYLRSTLAEAGDQLASGLKHAAFETLRRQIGGAA